jgi:hypothetical protein
MGRRKQMDDPVEKLAEQARELRLALTVRIDRSGKACDRLGTVRRESTSTSSNGVAKEERAQLRYCPGERRANVYVRVLPED